MVPLFPYLALCEEMISRIRGFPSRDELEGCGMTMQPSQAWIGSFNNPSAFSWISRHHASCLMACGTNHQYVDNS